MDADGGVENVKGLDIDQDGDQLDYLLRPLKQLLENMDSVEANERSMPDGQVLENDAGGEQLALVGQEVRPYVLNSKEPTANYYYCCCYCCCCYYCYYLRAYSNRCWYSCRWNLRLSNWGN